MGLGLLRLHVSERFRRADPPNIGVERFGQLVSTLLELRSVVEQTKFSFASSSGTDVSSTGRKTIGAKRLLREATNVICCEFFSSLRLRRCATSLYHGGPNSLITSPPFIDHLRISLPSSLCFVRSTMRISLFSYVRK